MAEQNEVKVKQVRIKASSHDVVLSIPVPSNVAIKKGLSYSWGGLNDYPNRILTLFNKSPTHGSIITKTIDRVKRYGIRINPLSNARDVRLYNENALQPLEKLVERQIFDYCVFNGNTIRVTKNRFRSRDYLSHLPRVGVRPSVQLDLDDPLLEFPPEFYFFRNDWRKGGARQSHNQQREFISYDYRDINRSGESVYENTIYQGERLFFPIPQYEQAIESALIDMLVIQFYRTALTNGFTAGHHVNVPFDLSTEDQAKFENKFMSTYTGTNTGNTIFFSFGFNEENPNAKVTIEPIELKINDGSLTALQNDLNYKIITGHVLSSPSIAGIPLPTGFTSQAEQEEVALEIWDDERIDPIADDIEDTVNTLLQNGGWDIGVEILREPLDEPMTETN